MALAIHKRVSIDAGSRPFCRNVPTVLEDFPETVIIFYPLGQLERIPNDGDIICWLKAVPSLREWRLGDRTHVYSLPAHDKDKESARQSALYD